MFYLVSFSNYFQETRIYSQEDLIRFVYNYKYSYRFYHKHKENTYPFYVTSIISHFDTIEEAKFFRCKLRIEINSRIIKKLTNKLTLVCLNESLVGMHNKDLKYFNSKRELYPEFFI